MQSICEVNFAKLWAPPSAHVRMVMSRELESAEHRERMKESVKRARELVGGRAATAPAALGLILL